MLILRISRRGRGARLVPPAVPSPPDRASLPPLTLDTSSRRFPQVGRPRRVRARREDGVQRAVRAGRPPRRRHRNETHRARVGRRGAHPRGVLRHPGAHGDDQRGQELRVHRRRPEGRVLFPVEGRSEDGGEEFNPARERLREHGRPLHGVSRRREHAVAPRRGHRGERVRVRVRPEVLGVVERPETPDESVFPRRLARASHGAIQAQDADGRGERRARGADARGDQGEREPTRRLLRHAGRVAGDPRPDGIEHAREARSAAAVVELQHRAKRGVERAELPRAQDDGGTRDAITRAAQFARRRDVARVRVVGVDEASGSRGRGGDDERRGADVSAHALREDGVHVGGRRNLLQHGRGRKGRLHDLKLSQD
eukprot:30717-Pelagococcus_subviridis.AAC.4